jgi:thymidylate synthase (FAD)
MNIGAKLVAFTIPVDALKQEGIELPEDIVAYCARVSNPDNQLNTETASKLLNYCARNNHWSIFEMANAVVELTLTRDIGRQVLRHRSFTFQEFSQRYASVENMIPIFSEARLQDPKNRQNSIGVDDTQLNAWWASVQISVWYNALTAYKDALDAGIAKEVARKVLPEGLTPSVMYMNGTLRSWQHYIGLRTGNGTQKEHIDVARLCADAIAPIYPNIVEYVNA